MAYRTTDPHIGVEQYMWHTLQYHRVVGKFQAPLYIPDNSETSIWVTITQDRGDHIKYKDNRTGVYFWGENQIKNIEIIIVYAKGKSGYGK